MVLEHEDAWHAGLMPSLEPSDDPPTLRIQQRRDDGAWLVIELNKQVYMSRLFGEALEWARLRLNWGRIVVVNEYGRTTEQHLVRAFEPLGGGKILPLSQPVLRSQLPLPPPPAPVPPSPPPNEQTISRLETAAEDIGEVLVKVGEVVHRFHPVLYVVFPILAAAFIVFVIALFH